MGKRWILVLACAVLMLAPACDDDEAGVTPDRSVDGTLMLGLVDGRTLLYQQVDTVITFVPTYSLTVSSSTRLIRVTGSGDNWIVGEGVQPIVNLKKSPPYVLHNGYWKETTGGDSLYYYPEPTVLVQQQLASVCTGYTPRFPAGESELVFPFLNVYFGFHYSRSYTGRESILVPAGAYTAYRYDTELFLGDTTVVPDAVATEYYEPSVGLIKLTFRGQGLNRALSLIEVAQVEG